MDTRHKSQTRLPIARTTAGRSSLPAVLSKANLPPPDNWITRIVSGTVNRSTFVLCYPVMTATEDEQSPLRCRQCGRTFPFLTVSKDGNTLIFDHDVEIRQRVTLYCRCGQAWDFTPAERHARKRLDARRSAL